MAHRPQATDFALLATLALLWGASFLFTDLALSGFTPLQVAAGRITSGTLALLLYARLVRSDARPTLREAGLLCLAGITGAVLPFALIAWAQQSVTSSVAAILIATAPFWTMLLAQVMTDDEPITTPRLIGAMVGFGGVFLLMGGSRAEAPPLTSALAVIAGALCYGLTGLILRRVQRLPAPVSAAGLQSFAMVLILPVAAMDTLRHGLVGEASAWAALIVLGVTASGLATIVMIRLLARTDATFLSFNNLLVPLVGTVLGAVFLNEALSVRQIGGLALVLAGLGFFRRG